MTDAQWNSLVAAINGKPQPNVPVGFIIDCPWLPNWYGISLLDYFSSDELWLQANLAAIETFPEVMFLPGFWSEYGMCTEPSAFGAKCIFWKNEFPFADKTIKTPEDIDNLTIPNPETDGLLPFMLNRLVKAQPAIESAGHRIRFSVSRGPLNIASFLMGATELMMAIVMEPDRVHRLMRIITDFLKQWHELQRKTFPSIDGIMMLDDIVGFIGEDDFLTFGFPYIKEIYDAAPAKVKLFHNDADFVVSVKHYPDMGVNLFNPGIQMSINEIKEATGNRMAVLGSIPPRDVLAAGTPEQVKQATSTMINELNDHSRFILSCAGGMPPGVTTENIRALLQANYMNNPLMKGGDWRIKAAKMNITTAVRAGKILVSDGAWGTFLQQKGLQAGECPELWNLTHPDAVREIAQSYIDAGADMIETNSFGGTSFKLEHFGLAGQVSEINEAAARLSREVAGDNRWVIGSVGPTGKILMLGDVTEKELYDAFKTQVIALEKGGANAVCIETMSDIDEAWIAIRATKENTRLEVICTFTFDATDENEYYSMMGVSPDEAAVVCVKAGADIIGTNCGNGLKNMVNIVAQMRKAVPDIPILVHANAGLPLIENGEIRYPETPEYMATLIPEIIRAGATIIGGCCGTTPAHIAAIKKSI